MQIVYTGPHPEVVVDELDQELVITAGQPTEIPDDLAARLLEQETWEPVDKAAVKVQKALDAQPDSLVNQKAAADAAQAEAGDASDSVTDGATGPENAPDSTSSGDNGTTTDDTKGAS